MILEVIATTLSESLDIEKFGGDRIELVTGIAEGGLTPSLALIEEVCNTVKIPVYVMVRPHGKSFIYNEDDKRVILKDIEMISKTKASGIVFGALKENLEIDEDLLKQVILKKKHLKLTFHRAFDKSHNIYQSLEVLKNYDVERILTSGGKDKAIDALNDLRKINQLARNYGIKILVGSGINLSNIDKFLEFDEVHIGSGVKFEQNNINEIDESLMNKVLTIIK